MAAGDNPEDEDDKTVFLPPERKGSTSSQDASSENEEEDEGGDDDEKTVFVPRQAPGPKDAGIDDDIGEDQTSAPTEWSEPPSCDPSPDPTPIPTPQNTSTPAFSPPPLNTGFDASSAPPDPSAFPPGVSMGDAPIQPIAIGDYVNVFRIERFIAKGGMGEVYEAVNPHPPHESVAVKLMLSDLANDKNALEMFYKEASALGRVHHEAIVQYRIASQSPNGQPYLITEFVDGPSLQELLGKLTLDELQLKDLTKRLSRGLGAAHRENVVHRDIAPDNVLLTQGNPERPKIIDFGIVKDTHENGKTIIGDGFAGKLRYVAPEQLGEYDFNVGPWTDIYSLALTMLAVASGKHADMGSSLSDAVRKRLSVPDLAVFPEGLRPAFEAALQPDPANRPQTMEAFAKLLDEGASGSSPQNPSHPAGDDPFAPMPSGPSGNDKPKIDTKGTATGLAGILGGANTKFVYAGVGGFVLLALLVGILVMVTSPGEIEEPLEGAPEAGPLAQEPSKPPIEQVAMQAAEQAECAWLSFEGSEGNTARFSGGAARQGAVLRGLQAAFASNGYPGVTLDTSDVVEFGQNLCPMVEALQGVRNPTPLVSSAQSSYEMEMRELPGSSGQQANFAQPVLSVQGLAPEDEAMLLYIEGDTAGIFRRSREWIKKEVENNNGTYSPAGFDAKLAYAGVDGHALILVTGASKFPDELFPQSNEPLELRIDSTWARQFEQKAKESGWRTDIVWFRITDNK